MIKSIFLDLWRKCRFVWTERCPKLYGAAINCQTFGQTFLSVPPCNQMNRCIIWGRVTFLTKLSPKATWNLGQKQSLSKVPQQKRKVCAIGVTKTIIEATNSEISKFFGVYCFFLLLVATLMNIMSCCVVLGWRIVASYWIQTIHIGKTLKCIEFHTKMWWAVNRGDQTKSKGGFQFNLPILTC